MQAEVGDLAAARVHLDIDVAHVAARNLPSEAQPVGEAVLDPIGAEFGRQEEVERAGFLVDPADLDRFDPLTVKLMPEILTQALADVRPVGRQVYSFAIFHEIVLIFLFCICRFGTLAHSHKLPPSAEAHRPPRSYQFPSRERERAKLRPTPEFGVFRRFPSCSSNVRRGLSRPVPVEMF